MADCKTFQDLFPERLDGPVEELDQHLGRCAACARAWERFEKSYQVLKGVAASPPPRPLSAEFFTRAQLARERPDPVQSWTRLVGRVRRGLAVAACLAALTAAGWIGSGVPAALTQPVPELIRQIENVNFHHPARGIR